MERESCHLAYRIYEWIIGPAVRQGLQREYLAALLWAHGNAVGNRPLLRVPAPAALVSPFTSTSQQMTHRRFRIGIHATAGSGKVSFTKDNNCNMQINEKRQKYSCT